MSDDADFSVDATPSLQQLATFMADELFDVHRVARLEQAMTNAHQKGASVAVGAQIQALTDAKKTIGDAATKVEDVARGATGWALAHVVAHMLGIEVPPEALRGAFSGGEQSVVGKALGETVMNALAGGTHGSLEPGDAGAIRLIGMLSQLTITSWFEGIIAEEVTSFHVFPKIEALSQLGKDLIDALGLGRLMRVALRPIVQTAIATPLLWKVNKDLRPNLLSEGEIIKAFQRGDYTGAEAAEELARLGYSNRRQDLLIKSAAKRLSLDDTLTLLRVGAVDSDYPLQNLRDEGFDQTTAQYAVAAAITKRITAIQDDSLAALKHAYANRELTDGEFASFLDAVIPDEAERTAHEIAARTVRDLNVKHLTHAEVLECLMADILPIAFYADWLAGEGYDPESATALQLLLLSKKDTQRSINEHRRTLDEQKAADAARRAQELADRKAALDAERRLKAEGPLTAWEHAVVTGLVPLARYTALLAERYDAETVATFTAQAAQARTAYLAQQQRAADAAKRAALHGLNVGQLEQAVFTGLLSVPQFRQLLVQQQLAPADADLLAATVAVRLQDLTTAKQLRADAAAKAAVKHIDLNRAELLVRRGHATLAQYQAFLRSLGYDDVSLGAMLDLLQLKIADDVAAQKQRDAVAAAKNAVSISFADLRRGVVLGVATIDEFAKFLVAHKFTVDAQRILLAELRDDVTSADAARAQRKARQVRLGDSTMPLSALARAARLGIISIAAYQGHLKAAGYSADDIAIDTDLLTTEIAQARIAAERAAAALAKQTDRGLSLTQLATAVKLDESTLDDYRGRALALGYSDDDTQTLVSVLADELAAAQDARTRHAAIAADLKTRNLSLAQLDAAVVAGALTIDGYRTKLSDLGYAADDVDLLVSLLELKHGG